MGFFDNLGKVLYGIMDFSAEVITKHAEKIDRMSDEQIEEKFSKDAEMVKGQAEKARMQAEKWQMHRDKMEMEREKREMQQEMEMLQRNKEQNSD